MNRLLALAFPLALAAAAPAQAPAEGKRYALLVGVSRYDGTGLTNLKYAEKDVTDLKEVLVGLGYKVTLVTKGEFKRTDRDDLDPTAENVRDHLAAIARNRRPEDTVLVALSGHGVHLKATNKLYYCPSRADLEKPQTLVAVDDILATFRPFDPETDTGCRANSKLLIMDACRNDPTDGRAGPDFRLKSATRPLIPDPPGGTVALFSCSKGQISHESDVHKRGFLMHYVIDGLSGKAVHPKTGEISWHKLVAHVADEVPDAVVAEKGPKANQLPDAIGSANRLVLGRVAVPGGGPDVTPKGAVDGGMPPDKGTIGKVPPAGPTGPQYEMVKSILKVTVPFDDAELFIEGKLSPGSGSTRISESPPLKKGVLYEYTFSTTWRPNNYTVLTRKKLVEFKGGEDVIGDLSKADPKTPDKAVIRWVPTPDDVVAEMIKLAGVKAGDVVYEPGPGDGRMLIAGVKAGAKKAVGIEIDAKLVVEAKDNVKKAGLDQQITIVEGDALANQNYGEASVVFLYMGNEFNNLLRPTLEKQLRPGTRIVSHRFIMGDWAPDRSITVAGADGDEYRLHLWTVKEK